MTNLIKGLLLILLLSVNQVRAQTSRPIDGVYNKYISPTVLSLITQKLPEWRLPAPSSWEVYWDQYKKDSTLVNYVSSDFNGDLKPDYAFILKNSKKIFAVWVLQSKGKNYQAIKLYQLTQDQLPLEIGIELLPKGDLNYLNLEQDKFGHVKLRNSAIQVVFFEQAAEAYYWEKDKYRSVTTGD